MKKDLYKNLKPLCEAITKWVDTLDDENPGIDLVLLATDNINKGSIRFSLVNKDNPIHSCFNAFNMSLGNKDIISHEIMEGAAEFFQRLCAENDELWKRWQEGVEYYKQCKE